MIPEEGGCSALQHLAAPRFLITGSTVSAAYSCVVRQTGSRISSLRTESVAVGHRGGTALQGDPNVGNRFPGYTFGPESVFLLNQQPD